MNANVGQLFDQFNTVDSYLIMILLLVAFLFGLWVGFLLRRNQALQSRRELEETRKKYDAREGEWTAMQGQVTGLKNEIASREAEVDRVQTDLDAAQALAGRLEEERAGLHSNINILQAELEKLQASNESYLSAIDDLNNQILGMRARHERLAQESAQRPQADSDHRQTGPDNDYLTGRLQLLEEKLKALENENSSLKEEIHGLRTEETDSPPTPPADAATESTEEALDEPPFEFIAPATEYEDDLTLIKGIDPEVVPLLREAGIQSWKQLAESTPERLRSILEDGGAFGTLDPESWPIQARLALNGDWGLLRDYQDQLT